MKLGAISFINTLPIYHGLDLSQLPEGSTLHYGLPTWLNNQAMAGALDLTPVSMSHYLTHQKQLTLVSGLSVSSFGGVESVLFVCHQPWNDGLASLPVIPVPDSSASSVALLGWLLEQLTGLDLRSRFQVYPAGQMAPLLEAHGCALTIGDEALLFRHGAAAEDPGWYCHDLATLWHQRTGLPFVFAVWVTPTALKLPPQQLTNAMDLMIANRTRNLTDPDRFAALLDTATAAHPVPRSIVTHYLTQSLNFDWSPVHAQAVDAFQVVLGTGKPSRIQP